MLNLNLSGKLAVVTGASGDLGRVMARTLADCGADVVVHYLKNKDMASKVQGEVKALGRKSIIVQADVTVEADVNRMRDQIVKELGAPHIIVNNAVIQYPWKNLLEQPLEDYESQFRSCVMHNVLMAKAFVPAMISRAQGGRVIGINTECAMQNFVSQSAYVAGKRGMDGVMRILAKEVGKHQITVNQVAPGWTISDRTRAQGGDPNDNGYTKPVPMGRRGTDQEIANVVAFLASDLSSYVTGQYIAVCGGNVMPCI